MLISMMLRMVFSAIVLVLLVAANSLQETKGKRTSIILRITAKQNVITYARQTSIAWLKRYCEMKNTLFLTIVLAFFPICDIIAQSLDVHGQVTDTRGNTLPGVAVIIKGTNDGAITDAEGRYSIQVPDGTVLEFSCMGYQTKEIEIKDRAVINVTLSETSYALDELVVVATAVRRNFTIK